MIKVHRRCFATTIARERANRRVLAVDETFDGSSQSSSLKLSKIPPEFFNFHDIHLLPPRELAYTAHLAHRAELGNERLWDRIAKTFMDSVNLGGSFFKPKQLTQCLLPLVARDWLTESDVLLVLKHAVVPRMDQFRIVDLIDIGQALANEQYYARPLEIVCQHILSRGDTAMWANPTSVAKYLSVVGRLNIKAPKYISPIVQLLHTHGAQMNQFELSASLRSLAALWKRNDATDSAAHITAVQDCLNHVLQTSICVGRAADIAPGPLNILMHALADLTNHANKISVSEEVSQILFNRVNDNVLGADMQLLPHLLMSCSSLASTEDHKTVCLRIASICLRQYKSFKAVSLVFAKEGTARLTLCFPDDLDVLAVNESMALLVENIVHRFLLLQSVDELKGLLASHYCAHSPWFMQCVEDALPKD